MPSIDIQLLTLFVISLTFSINLHVFRCILTEYLLRKLSYRQRYHLSQCNWFGSTDIIFNGSCPIWRLTGGSFHLHIKTDLFIQLYNLHSKYYISILIKTQTKRKNICINAIYGSWRGESKVNNDNFTWIRKQSYLTRFVK